MSATSVRSWRLVAAELALRAAVLAVVATRPVDNYIGDPQLFWERARGLSLHHLPYRDFLWEFPPLTTLLLVPAPWLSKDGFVVWFAAVMIAAEYAALVVLRRGRPRRDAVALTAYWSLVGLPLASFTWFRFDFLAVCFVVFALASSGRERAFAAHATAGFATKLWPAVLVAVPLAERRVRAALATGASMAAVLVAWWAWSPAGVREFLRYRRGRGLQAESTLGALRMLVHAPRSVVSGAVVTDPDRFAHADTALTLAFASFAAVVVVLARRRGAAPVPLLGALTAAAMLLSRILSPQYLVWLLPFAALAWLDGERIGTIAFASASILTLVVLDRYEAFTEGDRLLASVIVLRNALLFVVAGRFLVAAFARTATSAPNERAWAAASDQIP